MNAEGHLVRIAVALKAARLEAVLIGNAAAALRGAPVTTLDFDFCFRATRQNEVKIRKFAEKIGAILTRPNEPVSDLFRIESLEENLQVDFLSDGAMGIKFASLRSRATEVQFSGQPLMVASFEDIIRSKRAANRPKDWASLYVIEQAHKEEIERQERR